MRRTIDVDGRLRTMTVIGEPAGAGGRTGERQAARSRDLVLVLHGSKQTAEGHRSMTGHVMDTLAADDRTVVAYLDGHRGNWNDARRQSSFPARLDGVDDVGFVRAAVRDLVASHRIDERRVFVVGYSNGGQMAMRLAHEVPELLAGIAVVAAAMPTPGSFLLPTDGTAAVPLPVLLVHGTADRIVPFAGGTMRPWAQRVFRVGGTTLSAQDTAAYFARRNGIEVPPSTTADPAGRQRGTWIEQTEHRQDGHEPVRLLTVHGGGHTVPGPRRAPRLLGRTAGQRPLASELLAFFGVGSGAGA